MATKTAETNFLGTVDKALALLEFFSEMTPSLGLTELAKLSGRDKAGVLRYMSALQRGGFVEQDAQTKTYHLGPALLRLARVRELTIPTETVARAHMRWLRDAVDETTHLSLADGSALSTVAIEERIGSGTRVHFDPGEKLPYHLTASGLAYLAHTSKERQHAVLSGSLLAATAYSQTDRAVIASGLAEIRNQGFATSDQGFEAGVFGLAAPIFDNQGSSLGAIAVATPSSRMGPEQQKAISLHVCTAAKRITTAMGGIVPDSYCPQVDL